MEEELPDIPYTPMRDRSIDEVVTASPSKDPLDPKRPRAMTPAERAARYRANRPAKKKEEDLKKKRDNKVKKQQELTTEKREAIKGMQKAAQAKLRQEQTTDEREAAKGKQRAAMTKLRQKVQQAGVKKKEALMTDEISAGTHSVPDLKDTTDTIGKMDTICQYCRALKFKKETGSTCCSNGKVHLDPLPQPPEQINKLWHDDTPEGRLFRQHARSINNAVCLTSIKGKTRNFGADMHQALCMRAR